MNLQETLSGIDALVFPDVNELKMMNLWAQSRGRDNYADHIARIVQNDAENAKEWLKTQALSLYGGKTVEELLAIVDK